MKTILSIASFACAVAASAFEWPGGAMTVPYVFRGDEVFAGWVPSSPWGSAVFLHNPVVELRNANDDVVAEHVATGGTMDWYLGARRNGNAFFAVPAGRYTLTAREGQRLIRISGEGYSGFRLSIESLADPVGAIPPNRAPTIEWIGMPGAVASGTSYTIAARARDEDGNLTQVSIWKNGTPFASVGGGAGAENTAANTTSDAGPATVNYSAQATDGAGAASALITQMVTIGAPAPVYHTLSTSVGAGGGVTGGGSHLAGSTAVVTATPDATHEFEGWSGDAAGNSNPLTLLMDRDKAVHATFGLRRFTLVTSANGGGTVSAGGSFPWGAIVTLAANADVTHRFVGWSGDASGNENPLGVVVDRAKYIQANFAPKAAQTITVEPIGAVVPGSVVTIRASASSGLPVTLSVVEGPAQLEGDVLTVTGAGTITIEATQAGDAFTLPASPVRARATAASAGVLRLQRTSRTLLGSRNHVVIGNP